MTKKTIISKTLSVVSIILIIVLAIIFVQNVIFIVQGAVNPNTPPKVLGVTPLVVLSGSMEGEEHGSFPSGSMLILKKAKDIEVGDVIAYRDPASMENAIVTHRVIQIVPGENGEVYYHTKGDANNMADASAVPANKIIGEYFLHIPHMGNFALFLQEPVGMLLFIGVPVIAFILYDVLRNQHAAKKKDSKTAQMEAELERLRALTGEQTSAAPRTSDIQVSDEKTKDPDGKDPPQDQ